MCRRQYLTYNGQKSEFVLSVIIHSSAKPVFAMFSNCLHGTHAPRDENLEWL